MPLLILHDTQGYESQVISTPYIAAIDIQVIHLFRKL